MVDNAPAHPHRLHIEENHDDNDEDDTLAEKVFHLLAEASPRNQSESQRSMAQRAAHQERLRSYRPDTYFSIPLELSPLLCSLCGWTVVVKEWGESSSRKLLSSAVLSCQQCDAATAITIPATLSRTSPAFQKLVAHFRTSLWKSHAVHCRFQLQAKDLVEQLTTPTVPFVVPIPLLRVVPPNTSLELVVTASSSGGEGTWHMIAQRFRTMFHHLSPRASSEEMPLCELQLPTDPISSIVSNASDGTSDDDCLQGASQQLMGRLQDLLEQDDGGGISWDENSRSVAWKALALVLFGWDIVADDSDDGATAAPTSMAPSIQCHCCLVHKSLGGVGTFPVTTAHRYYCPWDCTLTGWASTMEQAPYWHAVVRAALQQPEDQSSCLLPMPPRVGRTPLSRKRRKLLASPPPEGLDR